MAKLSKFREELEQYKPQTEQGVELIKSLKNYVDVCYLSNNKSLHKEEDLSPRFTH